MDNKLLIFAEHQSTPNPNMPTRQLLYFAETLRIWLTQNEIELSARAKVHIPMPEFYVAYNGNLPYNKQTLTIGNEFINVTAKLVDIHFDSLKDKCPDNTLAGYAYFQKIRSEKLTEGLDSQEAFYHASEECKKHGYLRGVVEKEEFVIMYKQLFSWEDDIWYEGEVKGKTEGIAEGEAKGFNHAIVVVKNLMRGIPSKQIAAEHGRSVEEIEQIQREILSV